MQCQKYWCNQPRFTNGWPKLTKLREMVAQSTPLYINPHHQPVNYGFNVDRLSRKSSKSSNISTLESSIGVEAPASTGNSLDFELQITFFPLTLKVILMRQNLATLSVVTHWRYPQCKRKFTSNYEKQGLKRMSLAMLFNVREQRVLMRKHKWQFHEIGLVN